MAKLKSIPSVPTKAPAKSAPAAQPAIQSHAIRETVESIVIAFVLAFLFRTFEAEAFVIPTGSMAPTLMGRHKDVVCPECDYRYQTNASSEMDDNRRTSTSIASTNCPNCHFWLKLDEYADPNQGSFSGDRIIVSKFAYDLAEPRRWDVIVF